MLTLVIPTDHSPFLPSLTLVGYWSGWSGEDGLPDPRVFVDESWDEDERLDVVFYLERGLRVRSFMGFSPCRFCGIDNGNEEWSDGTYVWPEGLAHYVRAHGVRLPQRFIDHIARAEMLVDDLVIDQQWWRSQKP